MTTTVSPIVGEVIDLSEREALQITNRIRRWVRDFPADEVGKAYLGRIWLAMGYGSWHEWCDCELGGFKLPATERREVVAELVATGMSNRSIADVIDVDEGTVRNDRKATAEFSAVDTDRKAVGKDGRERRRPRTRTPVVTNFSEVKKRVKTLEAAVRGIRRLKPDHEVLEEAKAEAIEEAIKQLCAELDSINATSRKAGTA